jgi:ABC-type transport system substrate-binding protein
LAYQVKACAGRVFQRTLTAWAPATQQDTLPTLPPDLATDTGKVASGGRAWSFTLRSDVRWQDGKPVTCADVKYGISRTFAPTQITGGSTGALDKELAANVAAIALTSAKSVFVHGAGVKGYIDNQALFGTVDLATVSVR